MCSVIIIAPIIGTRKIVMHYALLIRQRNKNPYDVLTLMPFSNTRQICFFPDKFDITFNSMVISGSSMCSVCSRKLPSSALLIICDYCLYHIHNNCANFCREALDNIRNRSWSCTKCNEGNFSFQSHNWRRFLPIITTKCQSKYVWLIGTEQIFIPMEFNADDELHFPDTGVDPDTNPFNTMLHHPLWGKMVLTIKPARTEQLWLIRLMVQINKYFQNRHDSFLLCLCLHLAVLLRINIECCGLSYSLFFLWIVMLFIDAVNDTCVLILYQYQFINVLWFIHVAGLMQNYCTSGANALGLPGYCRNKAISPLL